MKQFWKFVNDDRDCASRKAVTCDTEKAGGAPSQLWERGLPEHLSTASFRSLRRAAEADAWKGSRWSGPAAAALRSSTGASEEDTDPSMQGAAGVPPVGEEGATVPRDTEADPSKRGAAGAAPVGGEGAAVAGPVSGSPSDAKAQ
ncbi:hypothetical protein ABVT39_022102 [Epinephelus coioides]